MIINKIIRLRASLLSSVLLLLGCSEKLPENFSTMPIQEQSLYQLDRFSGDRDSDEDRKPLDILALTDIKPGTVVIDLLGGGGYYTELFNYIVTEKGKVYIQNNSLFLRFSDKELSKRLKGKRLGNTLRLDTEFADMKLPAKVDLIFIGLSFHDIYVPREDKTIMTSPEEFLPQVFAALKSGGKLVITDHAAAAGSGIETTPKLHRIDEEYAKKEIETAGFKFIKSIDVLRRPQDNPKVSIWNKEVYHKTDRFVHLYEKP